MPPTPSTSRSRSRLRLRLMILAGILLPPILFLLAITIFSAVNQIPDELLQPPPEILAETPSYLPRSVEAHRKTSGLPAGAPASTLEGFNTYEDYLSSIPPNPGAEHYLSLKHMLFDDGQHRAIYRILWQPGLTPEKTDALVSTPELIPTFLLLAKAGGAPVPSEEDMNFASGYDLLRVTNIVPDIAILRLGVHLLMEQATERLKAGDLIGATDYISAAFILADSTPLLNIVGLQSNLEHFMHINETLAACVQTSILTATASAPIREILSVVPERSITELKPPALAEYRITREFLVDELTASFVNRWANAAGLVDPELRIGRDPVSWATAAIDNPKDAAWAFTSGFAQASRLTAHGEEWLGRFDEIFGAIVGALDKADIDELEHVCRMENPFGPRFSIGSTSDNEIFLILARRQLANQALFNINLAALDCLQLFADSADRPTTETLATAIALHKDPFTGAPLLFDFEGGAITIRSSGFDPADFKSTLNTLRIRVPIPPPRQDTDG